MQRANAASVTAPWIARTASTRDYRAWLTTATVQPEQPRRFSPSETPVKHRPMSTEDWSHRVRLPELALQPDFGPKQTVSMPGQSWQGARGPQAEAAARLVQPVFALAPARWEHQPAAAVRPLLLAEQSRIPAAQTAWMPSPAPEPVARFLQSATALDAIAAAAPAVRVPHMQVEIEPLPAYDEVVEPPAACELLACVPEPEPVTALVTPALTLQSMANGSAVELPMLTAQFEPATPDALPLQPPEACTVWMQSPAPEPVFSYLRASVAGSVPVLPAVLRPQISVLKLAGTHIPSADSFHTAPAPEPVMAGVWPRVAELPFDPIPCAAAVRLPGAEMVASAPLLETPHTDQVAAAAAAQPVESFLRASHAAQTLPANTADRRLPRIAACAPVTGAALDLAGRMAKPAPEAVESLLPVAMAGQLKPATVVRLQPFAVAASEGRTVPGFDAPRLAPPASQPASAAAKASVLPICAVNVAAPQPQVQRLLPNLPQPGARPLEFHANHARGQAVSRLEWRGVRFAPLAPDFLLRTVWDRAEDQIAIQPAAKKSNIAEVFTLPEAKPKTGQWIGYAAKIAAGIIVVVATWYGAGLLKVERSISVRASATSAAHGAASAQQSASSGSSAIVAAIKPKPKGTLDRVRESIATRAAVQYTDNLREGMEAWGAAAKSYPAGWTRNPDGYVQTGALALFNPTRNFTDYRMEFFGQIENKGIGWTVRSKDENNYHAMKFTVIEAGLRPFIAMVHYNVIDGKIGRKMQTPLNVMVHNHEPIQVAVNVKGNRFVTSIDGEEVDSFSDDSLRTGGVGFFSDAGEKARLYWVKVSKNDDWLGHVCAFLSGVNGSSDTAELWPRELPGSPWNPDSGSTSVAGAWIACPYIRASRKARSKSQRC